MHKHLRTISTAVLALGLVACGKQASDSNQLVVKIGQAAPLTGAQAHLGKDTENGVRLAIEELNAEKISIGGKPATFELVSEDDMADPRTATTVAQKFIDRGVSAVIGHMNSGTSIPASKIYHDAGLVQISPSATATAYTAQGYAGTFRVMANDTQQGSVLGRFAVQQLKASRIAVIDDRTAYGQGLADQFEQAAKAAGATIAKREFTNDKATDFNAILTSIKGSDAQLVFFGGMDAQGASMVKQMRGLGMTAQFMGGDGINSAEFMKLAGADAEGVVASSPGVPLSQMPSGNAFKQKFEAKYGPIQIYAPYSYDATRLLVEAMKQAYSADPAVFQPVLAKLQFNGVTAPISFDAKGDLAKGSVSLYRVSGGQWQYLSTQGQ